MVSVMMAALWSLENLIESVFRPNPVGKQKFWFFEDDLLLYENLT